MTPKPASRGLASLIDGGLILAGTVLTAVGVYFFKAPNGFATGGVSGLSILLARALPVLSQATYMTVINLLLLVLGALVLGRDCGIRTVICSALFSGETMLLEWLFPLSSPLTDEPLLELVYAVLLTGIGSALLFQCGASTGGTDIVALILKKYTSLDVGKALLLSDSLIASASFFIYGTKAGLFSLLGLFAKAFLIDDVIEQVNACKSFTIITSRPDRIADYIITRLHHGVTSHKAVGVYTGEEKTVLITVCSRVEGAALRKRVREIDPSAFMIVNTTSEIIGRGFRAV